MVETMEKKIIITSIILLIIDQVLKQLVLMNISYQETISIIPNFFYLTQVRNTGGAWSILSGNTIFLLILSFFVLVGIFYYLQKKETMPRLEEISYILLLGGILGNLIDRICYKGVIDYLGFIFGNYYFPVFNFADICIVCGVILLLIGNLVGDRNGIRSNKG